MESSGEYMSNGAVLMLVMNITEMDPLQAEILAGHTANQNNGASQWL